MVIGTVADVVVAEGLVKRYGDLTAVAGVSFSVAEGEVLGMLGPNGAGKTTTIEILEGLRTPTEGRVRVLGTDPARGGRGLKNRVGIMLQNAGIDGVLTVAETVSLYAGFYRPRRDTAELIAEVALEECADRRIAKLSGGQRRRVDLALALAANPQVLFLDEPTTGLDPAARRRTWPGAVLVPGQVRYQLLLLARSPLGTFISLVIPLMLLVALDLVTPEMTLQSLGGVRVVQFLTPAMASFAVLNAGFVDVLVGTTVAREQGVLTRLESTPLPTWAYFAGRLVAAALGDLPAPARQPMAASGAVTLFAPVTRAPGPLSDDLRPGCKGVRPRGMLGRMAVVRRRAKIQLEGPAR